MKVGDRVLVNKAHRGTIANVSDYRPPSMKYAVDLDNYDGDYIFVGEDALSLINPADDYDFLKRTGELEPKQERLIRNWNIERVGNGFIIVGYIFNDPRFPDHTPIRTSRLREIDFVDGIAKTRNTIYKLEVME